MNTNTSPTLMKVILILGSVVASLYVLQHTELMQVLLGLSQG